MAEYIEREALRNAVKQNTFTKYDYSEEIDFDDFEKVLDRLPAADVAPVWHGRWESVKVPNQWDKGRCSACKRIFESYVWGTNYCPCCGAKMDGGDGV